MKYLHSPAMARRLSAIHQSGLVPYAGDISVLDRARVSIWFELHVPNAKAKRHIWIGKAPLAHAFTVMIASRHYSDFTASPKFPREGTAEEQERYILAQAWDFQMHAMAIDTTGADVDLESLKSLEVRMFEVSKAAGPAGYWQWGLDAGDHQEAWDPYANLPGEWHYPDAEYDDDKFSAELEVRGQFCNLKLSLSMSHRQFCNQGLIISKCWPKRKRLSPLG
jgi:hypothetical protein